MRVEPRSRQVLVHCAVIIAIVAALSAGGELLLRPTFANPQLEAATAPAPQGRVVVDTGPPSIPADGSFAIRADVRVDEPTPYLEVRLQIHRPAGQLLFQRTEVRSDVETGTVTAEFERELADLSLAPDAYPYEIRIRTEVGEPREQRVNGVLLIHAPDPEVTPVAVVVRVAEAPGFDPAGHFAVDPAASTTTLDQVALLAGSVIDDPDLRMTLGLPGMTLDGWRRVAGGYTLSGPEGLVDVPADDGTPLRYAEVLSLIGEAVMTGRLELLDIPYADPDVGALAEAGSLLDLGVHYEHSRSSYLAALETSPSAGTAVVGDRLSPGALEIMKGRGIAWVLAGPDSLSAGDSTPTAGVWSIDGSPVRALVLDRILSVTLASADAPDPLLHLFEHANSDEATAPLVASAEIGPGRDGSAERILSLARLVRRIPWAQTVTASGAAGAPVQGSTVPPERVVPRMPAPSGYADEVQEARTYAVALEAATGVDDPDSRVVTEASLIAQSARWAGPDARWSQADRGRAFAAAAVREASNVLDRVSLAVSDITLAGSRGDLPMSIANSSPKDLSIKLIMRSGSVHLPRGDRESLTLRPQDNPHAIPVDLKSSLSGRIDIEVWAGDLLLDSTSTTVRASYLDRLAVIGGVTILLAGLLLFIRKRVRGADTDTMRTEVDQAEDVIS